MTAEHPGTTAAETTSAYDEMVRAVDHHAWTKVLGPANGKDEVRRQSWGISKAELEASDAAPATKTATTLCQYPDKHMISEWHAHLRWPDRGRLVNRKDRLVLTRVHSAHCASQTHAGGLCRDVFSLSCRTISRLSGTSSIHSSELILVQRNPSGHLQLRSRTLSRP